MPSKISSYKKSLQLILTDLEEVNTELTNRVKAHVLNNITINTESLNLLLEQILTHTNSIFDALSSEIADPLHFGILETVSKISDLIGEIWNSADQKVSVTTTFNQELLQEIKDNIHVILSA